MTTVYPTNPPKDFNDWIDHVWRLIRGEEICEDCKGTGEIEKNFPATETHLEFDAPVVCFWCDGTGKIKTN